MNELTYPGLHKTVYSILEDYVLLEDIILDAGAGEGAFTQLLYDKGFRNVYTCDIEPRQFKCEKGVCFSSDLDIELPLPNNYINIVLAVEVIEHLLNPLTFFGNVSRVLKPGGLFLVTVPDITNLRSRLKFLLTGNLECYSKDIKQGEHLEHVSIHTEATLKNLANTTGFKLHRQYRFRGRVSSLNKIFLFKKNGQK